MLCLPEMSRDNITGPLSSGISPDLIFFEEDFANEYTFMSKLLRGMHNNKMLFFVALTLNQGRRTIAASLKWA